MVSRTHLYRLFVLGASLAGCSPETMSNGAGIGADDADAAVGDSPRGYAVISGDYTVISVGVLHPDGELREREVIHSGSAPTGLVTAFSGDVVLAGNANDPGVLTLIDRFRADVITRIDLASGDVLGQVKTQTPNSESTDDAYSSNPHDYVLIDERSAWVSRYEPNPDVEIDDIDRGADLFRIDPTDFERTRDRIEFSEWDSEGERESPDTGEKETVHIYARPSALVQLGDYMVVGIDAMSRGYDAAGPGMVALVHRGAARSQCSARACRGGRQGGDGDGTRVAIGDGFYRACNATDRASRS